MFTKVGELFCGPGGGGLGASLAALELKDEIVPLKHVWATDFDRDSCNTYLENISSFERTHFGFSTPPKVINADVRDLNLGENGEFEEIDGLIFGFPCNDFSLVGKNKGLDGKYGPLYSFGVQVLTRIDKPKWFVAENVSGITSSNDGRAFQKILDEMSEAGYNIYPHLYKFHEYGIPQKRSRVIIVGIREDQNYKFEIPKPTYLIKTAREALSNIPKGASHQEQTRHETHIIERLKHINEGENAWNADIPENLKLKKGKTTLSQIYKRLKADEPAYTVTGSGGGGTHIYHWRENRALTNRERARLQTFPDNYQFSGSKESVRKQIGMAIPPDAAKVIFLALFKSQVGLKYDGIPSNISVQGNLF